MSGAAAAGPEEADARARLAMWPLVQPLIAFGIDPCVLRHPAHRTDSRRRPLHRH